MGYTHYWRHHRKLSRPDWDRLVDVIQRILATARADGLQLSIDHDGTPLSAHDLLSPITQDGDTGPVFSLNGAGYETCETFTVFKNRPAPQLNEKGRNRFFDFCKTRQLPYDTAVTAVLCVFESLFPKHVDVSSDGSPSDWVEGLDLARRALPDIADDIDLPESLRFENQWSEELRCGSTLSLLVRKDGVICLTRGRAVLIEFPREQRNAIEENLDRWTSSSGDPKDYSQKFRIVDRALRRLKNAAPCFDGHEPEHPGIKSFPAV